MTISAPEQSPAAPSFARGFDNLDREHGFVKLRVEGAVPPDLDGTLYRNGAGLMQRFGERYAHWFDADGAISAVRIKGGAALGAAKIVKTKAFEQERWAGRRLYGGYNTPIARPIQELLLGERKNPANTSVLAWQRRLFATCEGGLPVEVSPEDIATHGETCFGEEELRALSAHPHDVPARRAIYGYGLRAGRKTVVDFLEFPYHGRARRLGSFSVKGVRMLHDFIATDRHLCFVFAPFFFQVIPLFLKRGGPIDTGAWKAEMGTEIIVIPIDEPSRVMRMTAPAFLLEHTVNAFEDRGSLIFDFTHYEHMAGLEGYAGKIADGVVRDALRSTIRRGIIDLGKRTIRFEERLSRALELPRVAPRVDARPYRVAYFAGWSSDKTASSTHFDALVKADIETGKMETISLGPDQYPGEAVFVPRKGDRAEDDGYLLSMVYDAKTHTSHLAVLDAKNPSRGALARAHFDHHVPFGFHGVWVEAG